MRFALCTGRVAERELYRLGHRVLAIRSGPEQVDHMFETGDSADMLRLKVVRGAEVLLLHEGDALRVGRTIWRALGRLTVSRS